MKYLKGFFILTLLSVFYLNVNAQLIRDLHRLFNPNYFNQNTLDTNSFEPWKRFTPGETKYSLEVGSGFSTFEGGNSFSSSFVSPMVSFSPTERLQIVAGGKFSYANFSNLPMNSYPIDQANEQGVMGNPTEAFAYGRYLVNSKLSIYGMGAFGKNQIYMSPFQSGIGTSDYQQVSFGLDYKITEKTSIGASFLFYNNNSVTSTIPFNLYRNQPTNPFFH